ncbi:MAG TPA: flagellar basal body P-ring formation chaperone FlgA [Xanthobacteraceae bacterium]|nr:flagellar basal body P-ring formation chaperone FlgA [Xanthobacteraceae bacterium]
MTSATPIRLLIASAALALSLGSAAAQTPAAPALKASVTVTGDIVTIGDLVDNAGPVADVPIFRAPDLGTTGAVATDRVLDAIRPHQLIGIDTHGLSEVVVTRASRAISPREISSRIAQALSGQFGFGGTHDILVNLDGDVRALQVEANATGELRVMALSYDPRTARFDITLDLPGSARLLRQPVRYTGTAIGTVDALAVNRPIERGEVIAASDLTTLRRPQTAAGEAMTDAKAVIGLAARHALRPGQPLASGDVMKPEIVARNDTVTIVYQVPGVTLTLRGQAKDAGALGDTISVINVESKRVVQAVISGPDRVTVGPISTQLVDNTATLSE